jgi:hypothetical protein
MAKNPLHECGLSPQYLAELMKRGGVAAIRQAVQGQKRSASRTLHPDITGVRSSAFYTKLLNNVAMVEKMSDKELSECLAKIKQPPAPSALPALQTYSAGKILRGILSICRNGHLPCAREMGYYQLAAPIREGTSSRFVEKSPLSAIRPTEYGIAHKYNGEWVQEDGLFFAGSFSRKIDAILRTALPIEYRSSLFTLPGQTLSGRLIRTLIIPDATINEMEKFYTPEIVSSNVLALVDTEGRLFHAGFIYEKKDLSKS